MHTQTYIYAYIHTFNVKGIVVGHRISRAEILDKVVSFSLHIDFLRKGMNKSVFFFFFFFSYGLIVG